MLSHSFIISNLVQKFEEILQKVLENDWRKMSVNSTFYISTMIFLAGSCNLNGRL